MKRIIAGLAISLSCMSASAVQCVINPTSSRYNVDTYVRNQTACKTTQYAGGASIGRMVTAVAVLGIVLWFIDKLKEDGSELAPVAEEIVNTKNYAMVTCKLRHRQRPGKEGEIHLVVGEDKAVGQLGGKNSRGLFTVNPEGNYVHSEKGKSLTFYPKEMAIRFNGSGTEDLYVPSCVTEKPLQVADVTIPE